MKIIDTHQDLLSHLKFKSKFNQSDQTDWDALRQNNFKCTVVTAFPDNESNEKFFDPLTNDLIELELRDYVEYCATNRSWSVIKNGDEMKRVVESGGQNGIILHIEGLNVTPDESRLEKWYEFGLRSVGIVWNLANELGGGAKSPDVDLTQKGKEVIKWLSQKRMIADFAHMNRKTFFSAAEIYKGPIVVSHGNVDALCRNERNYTDEQLNLIKQTNGIIGVFFARTFVTGTNQATVKDVANHIDYIIDKTGIDCVGIGSDFGGIITGQVESLGNVNQIENLWDELKSRGYSEDQISAIAYKNALRVYSSIL